MSKKLNVYILISLSVFVFAQSSFAQKSPKWSHFEAGIFEKAKKENKLVLLHLRANWCHWCHVMEEKTYADAQVILFLEKNYIACMEDHDERQDLTSLYSDYGWPATIIFDSQGNELFKEAGYIPLDEFLATLTKLKKEPQPISKDNNLANIKLTTNDSVKQASLNELLQLFKSSIDIEGGALYSDRNTLNLQRLNMR